MLSTVALIVLLSILLAPREQSSTHREIRLTTYSANPTGARGIYDILARLEWRVSRRTTRLDDPLDTGAVYAILDPKIELDSAERMTLLRTVQAGGRLFLVSRDTQLTTLFHMRGAYAPGPIVPITQTSAAGDSANVIHRDPSGRFSSPAAFTGGWMPQFTVRASPPIDDTIAVFLWASSNRYDSVAAAPLMLGRQIGRGRAVLVADPWLLWNATVHEGHSGLAVQRAIEWLAPSNRRVIFDEYHQGVVESAGAGAGPDVLGAIAHALTDTAAGRAGVQVVAAALILLIALSVRPIPPQPVRTIQRRSLLEHVDALGRAYQRIHASRFGTQQLIGGLRRRHPTGAAVARWRAASDSDYLMAVQLRYGTTQRDIDAITGALGDATTTSAHNTVSDAVSDDAFVQAGRAIANIEHSMHTQ